MKHAEESPGVARRVVTADFHPALEDALLRDLVPRARSARLDPTTVVVPSNLAGLRLSRLLAEQTGGHANIRFMTLIDFASVLAPLPLPGGRAPLPHGADEIILRRLIDDGAAAGGYFEAIADRPGLSAALLASIRDLKEASYDPDSFDAAAAGTRRGAGRGSASGVLGGGRTTKLADLARIWRSYEGFLARNAWADASDIMRIAAERVKAAPLSLPSIAIYGFYDLNALQKRVVAAYSERAESVIAYLPYVDSDDFLFAKPTLEWFLSVGFERDDLTEADGRNGRPALAGAPRPARPMDTIIISAPGEAREAREDVRTLVGILERHGLSLQDAAVLLRSPDTYSDLFAEEFAALSAPAPYIDSPPPLSRTRAGRALLALAQVVESDFSRTEVMEFLSLADLDPARWGGAPSEAPTSDWNAASNLAGVTSGSNRWEKQLRALKRRLDAVGDEFASSHRRIAVAVNPLTKLLRGLFQELSAVRPRATVSDFLARFAAILAAFTRPSDERATVLSAADRLRAVSPFAGQVTLSHFIELLRAELESPGGRDAKFGIGGPTVLSLMKARALSYRVVVVPGLAEKEFPLRKRQDPILLDRERAALNRLVGSDPLRALPIRAVGIEEEKLLFRLAVTAASDVAILSYPRLDPATARPRIPSLFVLSTVGKLSGSRQDYETLESSPHVVRIPLSRRFPRERAQALTRDEFDGCSILAALAARDSAEVAYLVRGSSALARGLEMEETRWTSPFFTRFDGVIESPAALAAARQLSSFGPDGPRAGTTISATALEEYAACPFRFFMHHVLGIEPIDEPDEALELSPLDRGTLYHAVLETFGRRMRERGLLPFRTDSVRDLLAVVDETLARGPWAATAFRGAESLTRQDLVWYLVPWLAAEAEDDTGLVPSYFEATFGGTRREHDDSDLFLEGGVPFDAGAVHVEFDGRIDRIDVSADGRCARVIDYKTGKPGKVKAVFDRGRRLQLPIYVLAARELLKQKHRGVVIASAEYRHVATAEKAKISFAGEELDERGDQLALAVSLIVGGIASGKFFVYPTDTRACRNCDYADACQSTAVALATIKNGDRKAGFYVEGLAGIA